MAAWTKAFIAVCLAAAVLLLCSNFWDEQRAAGVVVFVGLPNPVQRRAVLASCHQQQQLAPLPVNTTTSSSSSHIQRSAADYLKHAAAQQEAYPAQCDAHYHGWGYIEHLRSSMQPVCWPQEDSTPNSLLLCSFQRDPTYNPPHGLPEAYCAGSNLALDLAALQGFLEQPAANLLHGTPGLLIGNCTMRQPASSNAYKQLISALRPAHRLLERFQAAEGGTDKWMSPSSFGHGGQDWLRTSFRPALQGQQQTRCVAWVEHPLFFVGDRYDPHNVWHAMEDLTHAFESYSLMAWGPDAQLVIVDATEGSRAWDGYTYAAVWQKAFSTTHPPTTLKDLIQQHTQGRQLAPGDALCFREGAWNVHGGVSLLSRGNGQVTPCINSTLVNGMVSFLLDRLGVASTLPPSHSTAAYQPQATSQEPYTQLGLRGGLASGGQQPPTLTVVWALRGNRASHQAAILALLEKQQPELGVQVLPVDFGRLGIEEQIRVVRGADVLVGYHGAALTLSLFMPVQSALVEIQESYRCHCYTNAAAWRNRPYYLLKNSADPSFPAAVVSTIKAALGLVRQRIHHSMAGLPISQAPNAFQM